MGLFSALDYHEEKKIAQEVLGPTGDAENSGDCIYVSCRGGWFWLREVSGPVAASCDLFVRPAERRKGWSDKFETVKQRICQRAGVKLLLATVNESNAAELAAIKKHGWEKVASLDSVGLWAIRPDGGELPDFDYLAG